MGQQKFQRGDIARVIYGHPVWTRVENKIQVMDVQIEAIGKLVMIEGSYNDMFGSDDSTGQDHYSVVFLDDGHTEAWKYNYQLELVEKGHRQLLDPEIPSDKLWTRYNSIANDTRAMIASLGMNVLALDDEREFLFGNHGLDLYPTVIGNSIIAGITREDDQIKLIVQNEQGAFENVTLYNENIHLMDLIEVLENLENYGNSL